jgi:multidrug efflux system membrane fusion protein
LLIEERRGITLIPNAAVQRNTQNTYVWLVNSDSSVTVRPVTLGVSEGEQTQVMSGLNPGDSVVTVGVDRLQEGSKVSLETPKNKPGAKKASSPAHS